MASRQGAKGPTRRAQLGAALFSAACLALWASGIRVHMHVDIERRGGNVLEKTGRTSRALRDLGSDTPKSAGPEAARAADSTAAVAAASGGAGSRQTASAAAGATVFTQEPRFDANADPFAQIAKFDRSTLAFTGGDVKTATFSQSLEDLFAYDHFFWKMTGGVFLEMGALDGATYSNTFVFEKWAGWTGVLIEPGPGNYANLQKNRPRSACVNAAVCNQPSKVHFVERHAVGGIWEFMTPEFRRVWHPNVDPNKLPAISCFPLSSILKALGVTHLNLWSLDVEGAEFEVLQTFDFKEVRVDVMVVEAWADDQNAAKNKAAEALILAGGLRQYSIQTHNRWYVRPGFVASKNPVLVDLEKKAAGAAQAKAAVA